MGHQEAPAAPARRLATNGWASQPLTVECPKRLNTSANRDAGHADVDLPDQVVTGAAESVEHVGSGRPLRVPSASMLLFQKVVSLANVNPVMECDVEGPVSGTGRKRADEIAL